MEIIVKEGRNTYSVLLEEDVSVDETIDEIMYLMSIVFSEEQVNQAVSDIAMKLAWPEIICPGLPADDSHVCTPTVQVLVGMSEYGRGQISVVIIL